MNETHNSTLTKNSSKTEMKIVYVALGSNIDNPPQQLSQAVQELASLPQTNLIKTSTFYWTKPVGPQNQPNYLNGVAAIASALLPEELLTHLLAIEKKHHRTRTSERFGPRTLDLDLLLYDMDVINLPHLTIPHPRMKERNFVIYPLAEIAPDLVFPSGERIQSLMQGLEPLSRPL